MIDKFDKFIDLELKIQDKYQNKYFLIVFSLSIIGCIFWKLQYFKIGSLLTLIPLLSMIILGTFNFIFLIIYLVIQLIKKVKK